MYWGCVTVGELLLVPLLVVLSVEVDVFGVGLLGVVPEVELFDVLFDELLVVLFVLLFCELLFVVALLVVVFPELLLVVLLSFFEEAGV